MMVYEISPEIKRFELEMSISRQLRFLRLKVNVYAFRSKSGVTLFDCGPEASFEELRSALGGCMVRQVFLTHAHADHAGAGRCWLTEGARVYMARGDWSMACDGGPPGLPSSFTYSGFEPTDMVQAGDEITLGDYKFAVIAIPGHTAGSICYYAQNDDILVCGDLLFGPLRSLPTSVPELVWVWGQQAGELKAHLESLDGVERLVSGKSPLLLVGHGSPRRLADCPETFRRTRRILRAVHRLKRR